MVALSWLALLTALPEARPDAPFRVSLTEVVARRRADAPLTQTEFKLNLEWDAATPVLRVDAVPTITHAEDSLGVRPPPPPVTSRVAAEGQSHTTIVRVEGIPRRATHLTRLTGAFRVTRAGRFLTVDVPTPGVPVTVGGHRVTVEPPVRRGDRTEVVVRIDFPESGVTFESFEAGVRLARTRFQLVRPTGERLTPLNLDERETDRSAVLTYRFAGDLPLDAAWSAVLVTPGPLEEVTVPFTVTGVALP